MDLNQVDLLDLQTSYMKQDPTTIAMCAALNSQFKQLGDEAKCVLIYSRISELDEIAVDELAWQMSVDWYNAKLDLATKRNLVKNALKWHKRKGTPVAVEEAIATVFGRSKIEEWFEYDGEPFFFRVQIEATNRGASEEDLKLLDQLINAYKNKRSWVDVINIFLSSDGLFCMSSSLTTTDEVTIYPWRTTQIKGTGAIYLTAVNQCLETTTIYPKEE